MGNVLSPELLEGYFNIIPVSGSYALAPHLTFLGQIPRVLEFENTHSKVVTKLNGDWEEDKLLDDTSLVFDGEEGLVILSGWAHAGICNTVEAAWARLALPAGLKFTPSPFKRPVFHSFKTASRA